jgi:class 3 adenylate cyclase
MIASQASVRSYLSELLASRLAERREPLKNPVAERLPAAVLFADISGFTALAETLADRGPRGIEELSDLLNAYFGQLITLISDHGGDVIALPGDALLAAWHQRNEDVATSTQRASQCALAVSNTLHGYPALDRGTRLALRIGVAAGDVTVLHIGGTAGQWRVLLAGAPVIEMARSEQRASPGDVVLSAAAWQLVRETSTGEVLPGGYARLDTAPSLPLRPLARSPQRIGEAAHAYVIEAVRARVAAGQADWLAELRQVTPVFLNLLNVDPASPDVLEPAQHAMAALQSIVVAHEGTLTGAIVDDKGLTLIAVFGLPPVAHEDDPVRAARAALSAQAALHELGVEAAIGVATGRAYCGAVGTENRREYTVLGDVMNLAARLMQAARGTILCDQATQRAACSTVSFERQRPFHVKGKTAPVAAFRPVRAARKSERRSPDGRAVPRAGDSARAPERT